MCVRARGASTRARVHVLILFSTVASGFLCVCRTGRWKIGTWPVLRQHTDSIKFFVGDIQNLQELPGGVAAISAMLNKTGMVADVEAGGLRGFACLDRVCLNCGKPQGTSRCQ